MIAKLYPIYWKLERAIAPGLESSQNVYARTLGDHVGVYTRWLDLGCGHQLFPPWIKGERILVNRAEIAVGIDPDVGAVRQHSTLDNRVAGLDLPFRDSAFTLVTANMVFEHLEDPAAVLRQIRRVLAPGGCLIVHTPNRRYWKSAVARLVPQGLKNWVVAVTEDRKEDDVYPAHYRINTREDLAAIASAAGFEVERLDMLNTSSAGRIILGPLVIVELLWIRLLGWQRLAGHRSNIMAVLRSRR